MYRVCSDFCGVRRWKWFWFVLVWWLCIVLFACWCFVFGCGARCLCVIFILFRVLWRMWTYKYMQNQIFVARIKVFYGRHLVFVVCGIVCAHVARFVIKNIENNYYDICIIICNYKLYLIFTVCLYWLVLGWFWWLELRIPGQKMPFAPYFEYKFWKNGGFLRVLVIFRCAPCF